VDVAVAPGESLLTALRERLGLTAVKDGCAPQGQCGCCTVLVDGEARVACVTPVERVAGRSVTTPAGLDPEVRDRLAGAFVATGGSQCGFCTPGIVVRAAALLAKGRGGRADVDRALAAHLCRCTGWQTIREAIEGAGGVVEPVARSRPFDAAATRAALEGGVPQRVGHGIPLGDGGFADDSAPRDALVAVPLPPGVDPDAVGAREVGGAWWVVGETLAEARSRAEKIQGRRTTVDERPPLAVPDVPAPAHAVRLATSWVEPAYLEPDASWCAPGGEPASPLANGGAFGGKSVSLAPVVARELADALGRTVRVVYSREDTVRLGPKRPPVAAAAWLDGDTVRIRGVVANRRWGPVDWRPAAAVRVDAEWTVVPLVGPPTGVARAAGWAEEAVLVDGALAAGGVTRERPGSRVVAPGGATADVRVDVDAMTGTVTGVAIEVAAGDPLDAVVLRSYCIGAAHMALGWVCTEGLAVDPGTGEVLDLTIRSFGIVRPARMPSVDVTIVDQPGPPRPAASDAVFAAVAAATWNAIAAAEGTRPEAWPARDTRAARALRR
jgi:aerobic-type carbon monoxide dehydrogenase small subunit (CoxS/CutS family)